MKRKRGQPGSLSSSNYFSVSEKSRSSRTTPARSKRAATEYPNLRKVSPKRVRDGHQMATTAKRLTPLEKQFVEIKVKFPLHRVDCIFSQSILNLAIPSARSAVVFPE